MAAEFLDGDIGFKGPSDAPGIKPYLPNSSTGKGWLLKFILCARQLDEPVEFIGRDGELTVLYSLDH
mgnify:CR=1 FL=1